MSFALDPEVAAVLAAMTETSGPMPGPAPVGDVDSRRITLNAMLEYANNTAQPVAGGIDIADHQVTTGDGTTIRARWYSSPTSDSRAAVLYLHGGGMILGSVPIFDGQPVPSRNGMGNQTGCGLLIRRAAGWLRPARHGGRCSRGGVGRPA